MTNRLLNALIPPRRLILSKPKIVVTGAAGFIGSALSNSLTNKYSVFAIDDLTSGSWARLDPPIVRVQMDLASASLDDLMFVFAGAEKVCHLAAVKLNNPTQNAEQMLKTNILGTRNIFEAAGMSGVKKVLFTSSLYAYGSSGPAVMSEQDIPFPTTLYGMTKLIGEQMLKAAGEKYDFDAVAPRLFFIYGPGQFADGGYKSIIVRNCEQLNLGLPAIINGDGNQALDYVFIDDCIEALNSLLEKEVTGVLNLSSGTPQTVNTIIDTLLSLSNNSKTEYRDADWTAGSIRFGSNERIQSLTGWTPQTPFSKGLKQTWEYYAASRR